MLVKPVLAKCSDRSIIAREHPIAGNPESWFEHEALKSRGLYGLTFDFFVDWKVKANTITPIFWFKVILKEAYTYEDVMPVLDTELFDLYGAEQVRNFVHFATEQQAHFEFIVFRDANNWESEESTLLRVRVRSIANGLTFRFREQSIERFKDDIREYSGGSVKIGSKGLFYGTSCLECALSTTDSLYPGDVDLLLVDEKHNAVAIIEFKKHNLKTPLAEQNLAKYYPYPDKRKYDRLVLLKKFLSRHEQEIPILVIYYPTAPQEKQGKLELLQIVENTLQTNRSSNFDLPTSVNDTHVLDKVLKAVTYHRTTLKASAKE